jgi:hypothetical protein
LEETIEMKRTQPGRRTSGGNNNNHFGSIRCTIHNAHGRKRDETQTMDMERAHLTI